MDLASDSAIILLSLGLLKVAMNNRSGRSREADDDSGILILLAPSSSTLSEIPVRNN